MTEEEKKQPNPQDGKKEEKSNIDILKQYEEIKANSVSKEDYDKLKSEYDDAVSNYLSGNLQDSKKEENVDIAELRKELYSEKVSNLTDLEFMTKTLKLRETIIKNGGDDPFLGTLKGKAPTTAEREHAKEVAEKMKKMVNDAEGSDEAFHIILSQRVV